MIHMYRLTNISIINDLKDLFGTERIQNSDFLFNTSTKQVKQVKQVKQGTFPVHSSLVRVTPTAAKGLEFSQ
jgi:hypothetical protein